MSSVLYLFVDTNLFVQCFPLEQLDWSRRNSFDEVRLIVSKPVLREIDNHKNKGNDRIGKRARATTTMFRRTLTDGSRVVNCTNPRVVLCVESHHQYSQELKDQLNYHERDDQLIGTAYEFAQRNKNCDVRLLTHDTTPMFTASGVGLPADLISDDWVLPPETSGMEKELASLKAENARLKKAEPSISIRCVDQSDSQVERYERTYEWFHPLTDEQVHELMRRLKTRFPLATDFGPSEPQERVARQTVLDHFLGARQVYSPATPKEIAKYREEAYPQWTEHCEQVLRHYHSIMQKEALMLGFNFLANNGGTRPATDALITVEAHGSFQIMPPPFRDDEDDDAMPELEPTNLSLPPNPPTGLWRKMTRHHDLDNFGRAFRRIVDGSRNLDSLLNPPFVPPSPIEIPHLRRDPNEFYYKPDRPTVPQRSFSLECDKWRHGNEEEAFIGEIHMEPELDTVEGALVCRIQASNLSKSVSKTIPVRITIAHISAFESAQNAVQDMLAL